VFFRSNLRLTVSETECLGIEHPCGTCDQILLVQGRSYFTTDGRSVSQYVLVSGTLVGLAIRYYLFKVEVTLRLPVSQSVCLGIRHPCGTCDQILLVQGRSYFTTDSQSVSMSWYRAPLCDLRKDITFCRKVAVLFLWGALSDERTLLQFAV
jgi:D-serine deaminase-like pyridoxal phosphate-dependent protein